MTVVPGYWRKKNRKKRTAVVRTSRSERKLGPCGKHDKKPRLILCWKTKTVCLVSISSVMLTRAEALISVKGLKRHAARYCDRIWMRNQRQARIKGILGPSEISHGQWMHLFPSGKNATLQCSRDRGNGSDRCLWESGLLRPETQETNFKQKQLA